MSNKLAIQKIHSFKSLNQEIAQPKINKNIDLKKYVNMQTYYITFHVNIVFFIESQHAVA